MEWSVRFPLQINAINHSIVAWLAQQQLDVYEYELVVCEYLFFSCLLNTISHKKCLPFLDNKANLILNRP